MSFTDNKSILVLLLATVVVSGCTGGGNEEEKTAANSVQVNEFSAFPNPAPGDQNTRFRMQVENGGDHNAENVEGYLFNPPFADGSGDTNSWRDTSSPPGEVTDDDRTLEFGDLDAPGETPSRPSTETVTFTSPEVSEGRTQDYTMRSQLFYKYGTDAITEIRVMGSESYQDAGSPQGTATIENDNGPVQMEIRTPTPIPIYDESSSTVEQDLCVVVRNQGSGVPFYKETTGDLFDADDNYNRSKVADNLNNVNVSIENVGRLSFKTDSGSYSDSPTSKVVEIIGGRAISCWNMQIDTGSSSVLDTTVPLEIDSTYYYRKESATSVAVEGRP